MNDKLPANAGWHAAQLTRQASFMRLAFAMVVALLAGCTAGGVSNQPSASAHGGTLTLVRFSSSKQTFELKNSGSSPLAYNHWFFLGPEPVAYCRDEGGHIRFCSPRVMLAEDDRPYTHESYIQPGESVRFQAALSGDEQVGVAILVEGREEALWLDSWTPNRSLERTRDR